MAKTEPELTNIKIEKRVVALLTEKVIFNEYASKLKEDDFSDAGAKAIFKSLVKRNGECDFDLIWQDVSNVIDIEKYVEYIDAKARPDLIERYITELKDLSKRRKIKKILDDALKDCKSDEDPDDILYDVSSQIDELSLQEDKKGFENVADTVNDVMDDIMDPNTRPEGILTGYQELDEITTGLHKSDLTIIAARPGMGKTAFLLNLISNTCVNNTYSCAVFSLEMSKEQLIQRLLSIESGVDAKSIKNKTLNETEKEYLYTACGAMNGSNIYIDDSSFITVQEMKNKCKKLKKTVGLDFVAVDYLQLMSDPKKSDSRVQEVSYITRQLKVMARELDVPVIALSQLSRACEMRQDKRPMLSDLRESGSIEQDADIVMFIYREGYYDNSSEDIQPAELIISKHRKGALGIVNLIWEGSLTRFT